MWVVACLADHRCHPHRPLPRGAPARQPPLELRFLGLVTRLSSARTFRTHTSAWSSSPSQRLAPPPLPSQASCGCLAHRHSHLGGSQGGGGPEREEALSGQQRGKHHGYRGRSFRRRAWPAHQGTSMKGALVVPVNSTRGLWWNLKANSQGMATEPYAEHGSLPHLLEPLGKLRSQGPTSPS